MEERGEELNHSFCRTDTLTTEDTSHGFECFSYVLWLEIEPGIIIH